MNKAYLDSGLSPAKRAEILLSQMTPEEKVGQMMQISCSITDVIRQGAEVTFAYAMMPEHEVREWALERHAGSFLHVLGDEARAIQEMALETRLGIPVLFGIDAVHGHALHNGATVFPSQLGMSCSWDRELIRQAGRVTAREVLADGLHWTFSPILCVGRDLRWGRIDETFGEDPYLIGELGEALIRGYQGDDISDPDSILACAKHYIAYGESAGGRDSYDSPVSYRKLKEVFLPPFQKAAEAGCATFMAGYQSVDGVPASANPLILKDILRDELGFDGFVVTDWNNVESLIKNQRVAADMDEAARMAVEAGNDMIMNTPAFYEAAVRQVRDGRIPQTLIDDAVRHILCVKFTMGLFEKAGDTPARRDEIFACPEHVDIDLNLTRESIVLLENHGILPLDPSVRKIAVVGPNADDIRAQYGDWTYFSHPTPKDAVPERPYYTMLEGIREIASKHGVQVSYHRGCHTMDGAGAQIGEALEAAADADIVVAVVGDCYEQFGEFKDRADLTLSGAQQALLEALKGTGKPLVAVLVNSKPLSVPWIKEHADAVLETFNAGMMGGLALGEIVFGETNPSGKLSISFPYHVGQLPVYYNKLPGWHGGKYMDMPAEPLYPFGYGLSYSRFTYDRLALSERTLAPGDELTVSVDVSNVGERDGWETVQLYVNDPVSSVVTPVMQLKGFERVFIRSKETERVTMTLPMVSLALVDRDGRYRVEPGEFIVMVGPDSRDASLLKQRIVVT